jgi:hypothetical protein
MLKGFENIPKQSMRTKANEIETIVTETSHTLYRGIFFADAPALQTASDTAKIAFAPS